MTLELDLTRDHDRHREAVLTMLRREFGDLLDEHEREDLVQTAWLALIERRRAGEEIASTGGFLRTVAWRRARDRVRNASPDPVDPLEGPLALEPDDGRSPEEEAALRVDRARCRQLVETLTREERAIVTLRFGWELKPLEIQRVLGIRRSRYNKLAARAMGRLAGGAEQVAAGTWSERHRALLLACEAGTATSEERERAAELVREDPVCRAMLAELRGWSRTAAALAPLPILFEGERAWTLARAVDAVRARLAETLASATSRSGELASVASGLPAAAATVAVVCAGVVGASSMGADGVEPQPPATRAAAVVDRPAAAPVRESGMPAGRAARDRRARPRRRPARAQRRRRAPAPRRSPAVSPPVRRAPAPVAPAPVASPGPSAPASPAPQAVPPVRGAPAPPPGGDPEFSFER
jgi:RNA polymerase sigma factor (sigma-70 family)